MEFSVRDWMIIIGVLLIVAVLLDGYRRVRGERRNRIKVTLTRQALNRAHVAAAVEPEPVAESNPELPNGGARVKPKVRGEDLQLDQPVPVLMESVHIAPDPVELQTPLETISDQSGEAEPARVVVADIEDVVVADIAATDIVPTGIVATDIDSIDFVATETVDADERIEPHFAETPVEPEVVEPVIAEPVIAEPELRAPAPVEVPVAKFATDYGDADSTVEPAKAESSKPQSRVFAGEVMFDARPNSAAQEVLIVSVISKDKSGFKGQDVLQILLACDLRYGNMNIFHRYEKANGKGAVQFSVANLVEPGTFDLDRIESFSTPGLCFFLALPGPEKSIIAFNYMVETAQVLVKNLNAELRDEAHSVMTQQTIEHCRQRIRDFERKQLTLHL